MATVAPIFAISSLKAVAISHFPGAPHVGLHVVQRSVAV